MRRSVTSSMILAVGYDSSSRILEIEFRRDPRVYRYYEVPEFVYRAWWPHDRKGISLRHVSPVDIGPNVSAGKRRLRFSMFS